MLFNSTASSDLSLHSFKNASNISLDGYASVQFKNERLDNIEAICLPHTGLASKIAQTMLTYFCGEHVTIIEKNRAIFIKKALLQEKYEAKLKKRDTLISSLFQDITNPGDIKARDKDHEYISLVSLKLLEEISEKNAFVAIKKDVPFGERVISLIAMRGENGPQVYAKASKRNKDLNTQLGESFCKKVFKVANLSQEQLKAMAKPLSQNSNRTQQITRITRENEAQSLLQAGNIPHINQVEAFQVYKKKNKEGHEVETYLYVTQFAPGNDLYERLRNGIPTPETWVKWALQICRAIYSMHTKANMLHLDLKPENILLTETDDVLIIDFELSSLKSESKGKLRGSPSHLPPELFSIETKNYNWDPTEGYDAWAIGCILLELKYGLTHFPSERYFQSPNDWNKIFEEMQSKIDTLLNPPDDPSNQIIKGLLALDPQKRMSLKEVLEQLHVIQEKIK